MATKPKPKPKTRNMPSAAAALYGPRGPKGPFQLAKAKSKPKTKARPPMDRDI
jgi:hypothetical protein